jgi:hypothetical protein
VRRIIYFILLIFTTLYGAYYWAIPALVKLPENIVFDGYKIALENPKIKTGLIPSVEFSAQNVSLLNDDKTKALEIKNPNIDIRLLPLIFRKVDIQDLTADEINAELTLDTDKNLRLGQYKLEPNTPAPTIKLHKALIEKYNINFDNKILNQKIKFTAKTETTTDNHQLITADIFLKNKVQIISDINLINNGIVINDLKVIGDNINAFVSGKVTRLDTKIPNLDLKIGVKNSKAENILPIIPDIPNLSPDMDIILLKQTGFWGDASANLEIKGKADYPDVYGNVLVTNAYMVKPIPNAKKATIKLAFKGDKMDLDVKVPTSPTQTVWVNGPINLDKDRSADLHITSTKDVDLKTAQIVLNPLHEILAFDLGPVPIMDIQGKGGINLHVIGTRKNPHGWGQFEFKNATVSFLDVHNMELKNGSGTLDFKNQDTLFQSKTATLNGKPISIKGTCSLLGILNFDVISNSQDMAKLLNTVRTSPMLKDIQELVSPIEKISGNANIKLNLYGQVKDINDIVFNKNIFAKGSIELLSNTIKIQNSPAIKATGLINFKGLNADFTLQSLINSSKLDITGKIKENSANLKVVSNKFNIGDGIKFLNIPHYKDFATINSSFIAKYDGKIDPIDLNKLWLKGKIYSNKGTKSQIIVNDGDFELKNSTFRLPKINARFGQMPVYLDGKITNVSQNPNLNLYINAKPSQDFFDEFFNGKSVYPIKLKGDVNLTTKISGVLNNINSKTILNIAENSHIYYMGATIGDIENPVKITIDNNISGNKIKINNLQYDKIINSQNNKPFTNTQLNASGTLQLLSNNDIGFNNFKIKTQTPSDAKIFNIIFRKPFMKQGVFSSDLTLNGTSANPKILGKMDITSIDIPFVDSTIRDINLNFKPDKIYITSKGTILTNDVQIDAEMKNKLIAPYILNNVNLKITNLDINKITDTMRDLEAEATRKPVSHTTNQQEFDTSQLIITKANIQADKIKVRNINADNFTAKLKLDNKNLLDVEDFKFNIAQGSVQGNVKHQLQNHKTNLDIHLNNANALIMSEALFDLKGQVYGQVNGDFSLSCNGNNQDVCFKTLNGSGNFKIADGRMPKLGSLEYLLKAGNIFKGGIAGLSINSVIDLITPLKTGNFESISGDINIVNGIANKINIYSSGHDLNMYMTGSYNIVTSVADMQILGSLSKNITTVFGKIKNASLNSMLNTIPRINDQTEKLLMQEEIGKIPNIKSATDIYRIFAVDINGDINGDKYVKSFKWVK